MASNFRDRALKVAVALTLATTLGGCSDMLQWSKNLGDYLNLRNGFLDPSQVGRFDRDKPWGFSKPHFEPILDKLDLVDEPDTHWVTATDPLPSDLVAEQKEYVLGEGDVISVSVFELVTPGLPYNDQKTVNELGKVTLQNIGQVQVSGLTPTQLEERIAQISVDKGFLLAKGNGSPGPQVSVQLLQSRARVFSALGQVGAAGTYNIIGTDFRLLDALSLARDIGGGTQPGMDYLYVIRPQKNAGVLPASAAMAPATAPAATNPLGTLDTIKPSAAVPLGDGPVLLRPLPQVLTMADVPGAAPAAPAGLDAAISGGPKPVPTVITAASAVAVPTTAPVDPGQAIGGPSASPGKIYVNGKWEDVAPSNSNMTPSEAQAAASGMGMPRVIRIPINKLKEGDPRYNIVIRPGDIVNVPNIEPGEFYLLGHVGRPGVYSLTGRKVTLKQAIAASGGLDSVAIPRRCDLIRRIGNTEVTVQVDLQRVFDGEQPDIFLKSNDLVNVGTDMFATFLAVTRNAYRASYGWGFTYDKNFYNQPVISAPAN